MKLTKEQADQLGRLSQQLRDKTEALEQAQNNINEQIALLIGEHLTPLVGQYNDLLNEAGSLIEDIGSDLRGGYDDKSERWQESGKGQEANEFIEQYENLSFDELDTPAVGPLALELEDPADQLDQLQTGRDDAN